jgi:hypothetical protein
MPASGDSTGIRQIGHSISISPLSATSSNYSSPSSE